MHRPSNFLGAVCCFFSLAIARPVSAGTIEDSRTFSFNSQPTRIYAPIQLRGYGKLSGVAWNRPEGTVLEVDCQDSDKAKLVQAKYLSDLQVLPGTKQISGTYNSLDVDRQGSIAAFCDESRTVILSAKTRAGLDALVQAIKPAGGSAAQVSVPMFLDRWDRFSFRHYDRPWMVPAGKTASNYDFISEFDYAKKEDRAGILIFSNAIGADTADEMLNTSWSDWVQHEC